MAKAAINRMQHAHNLIITTREPDKIEDTVTSKVQACHQLDPTDYEAVLQCFQHISATYDIDGVVNFCGNLALKPLHLTELNDWHQTININLNSAFHVAKAAVKMFKRDFTIVLISTAAASIGLPNHEAIAAAKSGVEGLARSIAATYAKKSIRCNVVAPGMTQTPLTEQILQNSKGYELSKSLHASQRLGSPNDIASAVEWLIAPENDWITGEVIRVDGGLSTTKTY
jgi:NAD(P)-dependent dehydrogenase (short-subunit alcohol dehydrogenase family)